MTKTNKTKTMLDDQKTKNQKPRTKKPRNQKPETKKTKNINDQNKQKNHVK